MQNEIRGIVETTCSALVFRIEPFWAHYYQEHATLGDAFFNRFTEVASRFDAGYIHKYHVFAEMLDEIVKQTTSLSLRVTPSIADKDSAQLPTSLRRTWGIRLPAPELTLTSSDWTKFTLLTGARGIAC